MTNETEPASENWLSTLTSMNWMKVPGAVKAIARLVTSTAETGAQWIEVGGVKAEQMKEIIRSDTEAKKALNGALTTLATEMAVADPAIVRRSLQRWMGEQTREQENLEGVARKAAENLNEVPPAQDTAGPTEDWMNHFQPHAAKASSEEMRSLWGRVLAGEIRQPGAVSLATMQFMSVLDKGTAETIEKVLPYVVNGNFIPVNEAYLQGLQQSNVIALELIGVGTYSAGSIQKVFNTDASFEIAMSANDKCVLFRYEKASKIAISGFMFNNIGLDLVRLLQTSSLVEEMASSFWSYSPISITVADVVTRNGDLYDIDNLREIAKPNAANVAVS